MVQPWDRVGSRRGDPFAQLDRALRQGEEAVPPGYVAMGGPPPVDTTPESVEEPDITLEFLTIRLPFARQRAQETGDTLLFDAMTCAGCNCKVFMRVRAANYWQFGCEVCGTLVPRRTVNDALKQAAELAAAAVPNPRSETQKGNWIKVFGLDDSVDEHTRATLSSSDEHAQARLRATAQRLAKSGASRPLALASPSWRAELDALREQFPNFRQAIDDVIEPSLAIAAADGRVRPAPLLLVGPPGCGKTYFASSLAKLLRTPLFRVDMSTASMGSALDGLAVFWGNSAPGAVFSTLAWGRGGHPATANPLGFLDEIDKVAPDHRFDPLAPLHVLLEVESAKTFEDQSLPGLSIDASHIRWVCVANDVERIPKPILSRLHVVHVEPPTLAETRKLFERVFAGEVRRTMLQGFDIGISNSILDHVVGKFSVREFKTRVGIAVGRALVRNRISVQAEDFGAPPVERSSRIGF